MKQKRFAAASVVLGTFLAVLVFCSGAVAAGTITGRVTDPAGDGLLFIEVRAYDLSETDPSDPYPTWSEATGNDGSYEITTPISGGDYRLQFFDNQYYWGSEWYNNKASYSSADIVTVQGLDVVAGIDAELACPVPDPPWGLSASDGIFPGKVALSWLPDPETVDTEYEIWRSTQNSSASATLLDTTAATDYDDTTAGVGTTYWYWVKTVYICGETSGFSDPDSGYAAAGGGLWDSAVDLGGGWYWLDWFGTFNLDYDPWVYHLEHGFLYPFGTSTDSVVFWDSGMSDYWWTSDTQYPYLYRFGDGEWLWYQVGSTVPRWFVRLSDGGWESW